MEQRIIKNIIPFGCCCGPATLLKRRGLRSKSCFFDWLDGNLFAYINIVNNNFIDVMNDRYFEQKFDNPAIVYNNKYGFSYVHLFDRKTAFEKQINSINEKVKRQIDNFKNSLKDNSLLLYYCRDYDEMNKIVNNQTYLKEFAAKHNTDFVFVFNHKPSKDFVFKWFFVPQNNIHFPFGGGITAPFLCDELENYLISVFDETIRNKNLKWKDKEKKISFRIYKKLHSLRKDKLIINGGKNKNA